MFSEKSIFVHSLEVGEKEIFISVKADKVIIWNDHDLERKHWSTSNIGIAAFFGDTEAKVELKRTYENFSVTTIASDQFFDLILKAAAIADAEDWENFWMADELDAHFMSIYNDEVKNFLPS